MQGYEAIPHLLSREGIDTVFSMLGGTNVPWIGAGVRSGGLRLVRTRHENTAITAAMGYARSTGGIGLCSVTRGPGFTNGLTALTAAVRTHVPIMLVVAESPTASPKNAQQIDQRALSELVGAGFHHIAHGAELTAGFEAALAAVRWDGRPQVVSIAEQALSHDVNVAATARAGSGFRSVPDPDTVARAVDALAGAAHPLIIAGHGAVHANCRGAIERLAGLTGARLANTLFAVRYFSGHPADVGLSGGWAPPRTRDYLAETDAVLAVGASLSVHTMDEGKLFPRKPLVIQADIDPAAIGARMPSDIGLVGDAGAIVEALISEWERRGLPERGAAFDAPVIGEIRESAAAMSLGNPGNAGLDPRTVMRWLDRVLPSDRIVVTDSGRTLPLMPSLIDARDARSFLVGPGFGSIGLGLGTAIGAAAAHPDRVVTLLVGDGAFMMTAVDLDAVRDAGLNLVVAVMNDRQYGSEIRHLTHFGLPPDIAQMEPPDFVALARVFGGDGVVVEDEADLAHCKIGRQGLFVIDARIDREADAKVALGM